MTSDPRVGPDMSRRAVLRTAGIVGVGGTAAALFADPAAAAAANGSAAPTQTVPSRPSAAPPPVPAPAVPSAPLFDDPIYGGASDPTVVYNRATNEWWMFYTQRRATATTGGGVAWVHGSDIGIASSGDGGATWLYRGTAQGLAFQPGHNTYWAPEIIWHDGVYHMYVVFVLGIPTTWNWNRDILHYTSKDLWNWKLASRLELSSNKVIDACVYPLPGRKPQWRMWYKDEADGSHIYAADSTDLNHWTVAGPVITNHGQEGPNVFELQGSYWMVTDPDGQGLLVYSSKDLTTWSGPTTILADTGTRPNDNATGHHCFVLPQGDHAYILYFTQFGNRTYIQMAPLSVTGNRLTVDRDTPFTVAWSPTLATTLRGGTAPTP